MQHCGHKTRNNVNIVLEAVKGCGLALAYVGEELIVDKDLIKGDKEKINRYITIVKEAVKENGMALKLATEKIQDNDDVIDLAIEENGGAIKYASRRHRGNEELMWRAMHNLKGNCTQESIIEYATANIKNNLKERLKNELLERQKKEFEERIKINTKIEAIKSKQSDIKEEIYDE